MTTTARLLAAACLALATATAAPVRAEDHINFGTDWKAEAEYGGYYEAVATGLYHKHGLDVTIHQGGPSVNQTQLLLAGRLDVNIASNSFIAFNLVKEKIPFRTIAAMFQKDEAVLIAHPDTGATSFESLKGRPIMISSDTRAGWWNFLAKKYGYSDTQIRPYNFNSAPFLADKMAVQQGLLGSEPFSIEQEAHIQPVVMLVADAGFSDYAQLFAASDKMIAEKPAVLQAFVDASIEGWYAYLHGDAGPGDALIKKDNPEMTDALLAYGRRAMVEHGILEASDAATLGIGAMTDARWAEFLKSMADIGLFPADLDVKKAYTLQFVDKKVGMH